MTRIRFQGHLAEARPGQDLLGALLDAGAPVTYACMAGSCRTCLVRVVAGAEHLEDPDWSEVGGRVDLARGYRLACQARVREGTGEVVVEQ